MRGTTPTVTITTDIDLTDAEVVYVTFKQDAYKVVEKTKDDLNITNTSISFTLTQKDTITFKEDVPVYCQVRGRFLDGTAVKSNIMETTATKLLKEGVI